MIKTAGLFIGASLLLALAAQAQPWPPDTLWTKRFDGDNEEIGEYVRQTSDGGFIVSGYGYGTAARGLYLKLLKTDTDGNVQWSYTQALGNCDGACVQQTTDSGYIVVGSCSLSPSSLTDVWLLKFDQLGDTVWTKTFGGPQWEWGHYVQQTDDGGYIIIGNRGDSLCNNYFDAWLIKTDAQGDSEWSRLYGGDSTDWGQCVQQTNDGGYIITGSTRSYGAGERDVWLIKTNEMGIMTWMQTYGGPQDDAGGSVRQTIDGGYIIGAATRSYGVGMQDFWLIKTGEMGNTLWSKTYGHPNSDDVLSEAQETADWGYVMAGWAQGNTGTVDAWVVKTNSSGDTLWSHFYGDYLDNRISSIDQTDDAGFILTGWSYPDTIPKKIWLVRLEDCPLRITATPITPPIIIPPSGGTFSFVVIVINNTETNQRFKVWSIVQLPDGEQVVGINPFQINLPPGETVSRLRNQSVPSNSPPGQYTYWVLLGDYPLSITDSDSFTFTKLGGAAQWTGPDGWSCWGDPFPGEPYQMASLPSGLDLGVSPNPFNNTAALSYQLSAFSQVSLRIYDTAGRLVATLVDSRQAAGEHSVTFDGSDLTSGIYLARLEAGEFTATRKLVLMK